MSRTLLSYILLLLLILTGWFAISRIQPTEPDSDRQTGLQSGFRLGNLSYYENGASVYSLDYANLTYAGHWTASSPRLVSYNGQDKPLILTARMVNISEANEFWFSGAVSLVDEAHNRRLRATEAQLNDQSIQLRGEAEFHSAAIRLFGDKIHLAPPKAREARIQAEGSPLQFRYQSIYGEARTLNYADEQMRLEQQVTLNDDENNRRLRAEDVFLKDGIITARGNAELRQQDWALSASHIETSGAQRVIARGNPLSFRHHNLTINATNMEYNHPLASIRGAPVSLRYQSSKGLLYGKGSLLERDLSGDTFLLQGNPAQLESPAGSRDFNAVADQIEVRQDELVLNENVHLRRGNQELRARYAVYNLNSQNWLLDGKPADEMNAPRQPIEIIIPQ